MKKKPGNDHHNNDSVETEKKRWCVCLGAVLG